MIKTKGLVEQHIHGAFGIDLMKCSVKEVNELSKQLAEKGVSAYFPTIMTDDKEIIKERIQIIKEAKSKQEERSAQIIGIHLEGPFINKEKAGIHCADYILPPKTELYKEIEDEIIKIITIAPELDYSGEFIKYLKERNIKISAGHCLSGELTGVNQVTHLYNAMGQFNHRGKSTTVSALVDDNIYTELIGDSEHVSDEVISITLRQKPKDKILLISDALPMAHSTKTEFVFAGKKIYNKNGRLTDESGVIAGSALLLCDIIKNLVTKHLMSFEDAIQCASENQFKYHQIKNNLIIEWNENCEITKTEFI